MSFFGALMGDFMDDDPFFGAHMRQMNSMMNMFSDPFGMVNNVNTQMALTGPRGHPASGNGQLDMMPFGFSPMMLGVNPMFNNFGSMAAQNGACHSFTSSSVMTMSNGGDGRPQVYQETSSMRVGPGGIKETKKTVSDSRSGTKKMAIGHHIGERAHIIERQQNLRTGDQEENQEFINLEEEEAEEFNQEWETKTRRHLAVRDRSLPQRNHRQLPALPSTAPSSSSSHHQSNHGRTSESRRRPRHHHPAHDPQRSVEIVECSSDEKEEEKEDKDESPEKPETSRKREHSPNQETSNKRHSASKSSDD